MGEFLIAVTAQDSCVALCKENYHDVNHEQNNGHALIDAVTVCHILNIPVALESK